jgi:hypothetical protein
LQRLQPPFESGLADGLGCEAGAGDEGAGEGEGDAAGAPLEPAGVPRAVLDVTVGVVPLWALGYDRVEVASRPLARPSPAVPLRTRPRASVTRCHPGRSLTTPSRSALLVSSCALSRICSRIVSTALRWSADFGVAGLLEGATGARGAGFVTPELSDGLPGFWGVSTWSGWQIRASASIRRFIGTHI